MKIKIAVFKNLSMDGITVIQAYEDGHCWADDSPFYCRLTETTEVELQDMPAPQVLKAQLKALAERENNLRAEFQTKLFALEEQRKNLLSLEAPQ